jgi:alpha-L-arabinofuranosidase
MNLSEVVAFIAVFVSLFSYVMQWRRDRNKPILDIATAIKTGAESDKLRDEITSSVLDRVHQENADLRIQVDGLKAAVQAEQAARSADKAQHEARHEALRMELQAERDARQRERREFQAQLDERDAVIVNLQGQLDKLQSLQSKSHGFK